MTYKEKLTLLYDKTEKDLREYEEDFIENCTPKDIINNAWDIYHGQNFFYNIEDIFQNYDDDDNYRWIAETDIDKMLKYDDNLIEYWINHRYDYRHSERYNLENIEDFTSALSIVVGNMGD